MKRKFCAAAVFVVLTAGGLFGQNYDFQDEKIKGGVLAVVCILSEQKPILH
ncbi:MAG: hypothetical protein ACR2L1_08215 [Pyrinomonadaceae bacterium]